MCRPVIPTKTAPNKGVPSGLLVIVKCSFVIMLNHSVKCNSVKSRPPTMVATIHITAFLRSLRCAAITAITIVNELASSTTVIVVEKMMAGLMGNGCGQSGVVSGESLYVISKIDNVSVSETINSHIPNLLEPIANGVSPPDQGELSVESVFTSCTVHRPRVRSTSKKTQSPSMKCQ